LDPGFAGQTPAGNPIGFICSSTPQLRAISLDDQGFGSLSKMLRPMLPG
jgi:hypothetical protein